MNIKSCEIKKKKHIKGELLVLLKNKFLGHKDVTWDIMMFDMELSKTRRRCYCQKIGKPRKKNPNPYEVSIPVRTNYYLIHETKSV